MKMSNQVMFNTIGSSVTLFFQWLIMMLIPKITNFSDAGIFAIACSVCSIFNPIATFSMNQYQIADQYQKYSENDYFLCRILTIIISFVMCIITIVFFGYSSTQSLVIIGYMLYRNILHFAYLHTATLQIENRLDYAGKCMILEGIVSFVTFIVCYIITQDLVMSVFLMAICGGGAFLLSVAYGYRKTTGHGYPMRFANKKVLRPMMAVGAPLLISGLAPPIITAMPKLMLESFWTQEIVGIFSTLTAPTIIIPTLVTAVFAPFIVHFSNLAKKGDISTIRKHYLKMVGLTFGFGVISLIVSLLFAQFCFALLYGDSVNDYIYCFHWLVVGITLYSAGMCGITVLITKDQGMSAAIASFAAAIIGYGIFIMTIPQYGIDAATYGLVITYGIFFVLISLYVLFKPLKTQEIKAQ